MFLTDLSTLQQISETDGMVNWKVARFFALVEMNKFKDQNSWEDPYLSEYPTVIYNSVTEKPRYYEFRVISKNSEVGAITCVADSDEGDPVQYIIPKAITIDPALERSISSQNLRVTDIGYPAKLFARSIRDSRVIDLANNETIDTNEYEVDIKVKDLLESADPEMLVMMGIDSQELYDRYLAQINEEETRIRKLWAEINEVKNQLVSLSDQDIATALNANSERATLVSSDVFILSNWDAVKNWYNPGGWCGPNAVMFIGLGLGQTSGSSLVPLYNNWKDIDALYKHCVNTIGTGPKLFFQLSAGLSSFTGCKITEDIFHLWDVVNSNIRNTGLPSLSLRSSILFSSMAWHYRTIIGVKQDNYKETLSFLFWTWDSYSNKKWYYMHDNGADGGNWWEPAGQYYHFHTAQVREK